MLDISQQLIAVLLALVSALQGVASLPDTHADETPVTMEVSAQNDFSVPSPQKNNPVVPTVPFYSQFTDIGDPNWKKVGCGIASLAMLIEYYEPNSVSVDTLLREGINAHAYLSNAGWTYAGLIGISKKYGLTGTSYDLGTSGMETAFSQLETALKAGPVMVSIHYKFEPQNPIPHLVIANGIKDGVLYYNDPASVQGGGSISIERFKLAWKKRYIEIRPIT